MVEKIRGNLFRRFLLVVVLLIVLVIAGFVVAVSKGLISTTPGATPFYTNASTNPLTTSSLSEGQSELITFWVNATGTPGNTYEFYAFANMTSDLSLSAITTIWNVTIGDVIYPQINFTSPTPANNTAQTSASIFVNVSVIEANEDTIVFNLFNSTYDNINSTQYTDSTRTINWTGLSDGIYYYNVTVNDTTGNENSTETRVVTIDTLYPTIDYVSPTENNNTYFARDWIFINVSIVEENEDAVTFYLYNSSGLTNSTTYTDGTHFINFTNLSDETYYYNVTANDTAGSENSTETRKILLDTVYPLINYTTGTEDNNTYFARSWVFVNVSVVEANEKNITFYLYNSTGLESSATWTDSTRTINWTSLADGTYYYNVTIYDEVNNSNSTETREIVLDAAPPLINSVSPANDSVSNASNIYVSLNVTEGNFKNITFELYNVSMVLINSTNYTVETYEINWTGLTTETFYYYNVTIFDIMNQSNTTGLRKIALDTIAPVVVNLSGMVENDTLGGENVLFNWTVTDNLDTNLSCYPTYAGSVQSESAVVYTANNTNESTTVVLPGGQHIINITCSDGANSHQSEGISYFVAEINITEPIINNSNRTDEIVREGDLMNFFINETYGLDFLNNVTVLFANNSAQVDQEYCVDAGNNTHTLNYTWGDLGEPMHLNITATAFNNSYGASKNVTKRISVVYLRAVGNTSLPNLNSSYANQTYNLNPSTVKIELVSDLDTLYYDYNLTLVDPDLNSHQLTASESSTDDAGFANYLNFSFNINKTGNWTIFANIRDYEGNWAVWNDEFYSSNVSKTVQVNDSNNLSIYDVKNGRLLWEGTNLTLTMPINGLYNVENNFSEFTLNFSNANFSVNSSEAINYTSLTNETDAPSDQRKIHLFDLETNITYDSYTLTYNYSSVSHTLNNESTLKIYKCSDFSNSSNCTWALVDSSIDNVSDIITVVSTSMSRFIVTENATRIETVPEIIRTSSSSTKVVYSNFNIITPGKAVMESRDRIILPITLSNPIDGVRLSGLKITATSNTTDLSVSFDRDELAFLNIGEEETVNLIIESHSTPGEYEISINVTSESPKFTEVAKIFIKLVDDIGSAFIVERIVLVQDLFKENPQCLEFNDYLIEAQRILDSDPAKAKEMVQFAADSCRDLITSKEGVTRKVISLIRQQKWEKQVMIAFIFFLISIIIVMWVLRSRVRKRVAGSQSFSEPDSSKKKFFGFFGKLKFFGRAKKKSGGAKKNIFEMG